MPSQADEHLVHLLGFLRRAYEPRWTPWTDKPEEEARQVTAEWIDALSGFPLSHVVEATRKWSESDDGERHPSLMDLLRLTQEVARAHVIAGPSSPHAGVTCDGSGWIETMPCPTCNPITYDVWCDPSAWDRWVHGTVLWLLSDRVEERRGRAVLRVGTMPQPCVGPIESWLPREVNQWRMGLVPALREDVAAQMHAMSEEGIVLDAEARGDLAAAVMAGLFHGEP